MHWYFKKLSSITTISSLFILETFPACFSCSNNVNLSRISPLLDGQNVVFEAPESGNIKLGDLGIFISVRFRIDLLL